MNIRTLLIAQIFVFVALLGVVLWATLSLANADGGDALYVNIAGRQRMLSQKAAKEALLFARTPTRENRERLEATVQLFKTSHRALRLGGETPLSLAGGNPVAIRGASDPRLIQLLDQVEKNWKTMATGIDELFVAASGRSEALSTLLEQNSKLLINMDAAVRYISAEPAVTPVTVDIAGRQRMLGQRTALQALLVDAHPTEDGRKELQANVDLFEASHKSLRLGGRVASRLDGSRPVRLKASTTVRINDKLDEVEDIWQAQRSAIDILVPEDDRYQRALSAVESTSPQVLTIMNDAVLRSQQVAEENLRLLRNVQVGALIFGLLVAVGGAFIALNIGSSLDRLRRVAEDISKGKVHEAVEPMGIGEVRALSQSFERMRFSLNATMDILERSDSEESIGV